jgi:hypothetical protein
MVEDLSPFRAVRNPCRLVDEQAAPQAKNGGWSDAVARLPFRTAGANSAKKPNQSVKRLTEG